MDAQELIKGLSDLSTEEVTNDAIGESRQRGLSVEAQISAGNLAVEGTDSFEVIEETTHVINNPAENQAIANVFETVFFQIAHANHAYATVARSLGKQEASPKTILDEFNSWINKDKLDYVKRAQEADPELKFTLVATPNILVSPKELVKLSKAFGEKQHYPTYLFEELFVKYTKQQLSGTNPESGQAVIFSLIPSKLDNRLTGSVVQQIDVLAELQKSELADLKVPSPLEAVSYWYALRANGYNLGSSSTFDLTYIVHFNLLKMPVNEFQYVPRTCVRRDGKPFLYGSHADVVSPNRVVLG